MRRWSPRSTNSSYSARRRRRRGWRVANVSIVSSHTSSAARRSNDVSGREVALNRPCAELGGTRGIRLQGSIFNRLLRAAPLGGARRHPSRSARTVARSASASGVLELVAREFFDALHACPAPAEPGPDL